MSFDFKNEPIDNFLKLYKEAQLRGIPDANAMSLATVNKENQPSVRVVLFKGISDGGFCFFTNYDGRKARDMEFNNKVCANFFWPNLDEQVRIEGFVKKVSREESEKYFNTRPRLSQIGAWTSDQSSTLKSFEDFKNKLADLQEKFRGKSVPCPPHWGGYVIEPEEIEFWFGRAGRLHERYVYRKTNKGSAKDSWERFLRSP